MVDQPSGLRRIKLEMSVVVDVVDAESLTRDAVAQISGAEFSGGSDSTAEQECEEYVAEATANLAVAVQWLTDPMAAIDHPGVEPAESSCAAVEVDEYGFALSAGPDFDSLFAVCHCGGDNCDRCGGFQITPRTAGALHAALTFQADMAYNDVIEHGDDPVTDSELWYLFDEYPRITHRQDAIWRRQAARAYDDLAADLAGGDWPQPHCPAEEMALHLALRWAEAALADGMANPYNGATEPHPDDYDWDMLLEVLVQDVDILNLFDAEIDGIEDPTTEQNQFLRMGDYRPAAWFTHFNNMSGRDPRRPFRR